MSLNMWPHSTSSAISRILSWATIPLGVQLLTPSSNLPESQCGPHLALSYLILLHTEFGCFHSSSSLKNSRSRSSDQCSGYSFCSTVPHRNFRRDGGALPLVLPYGVRTFLTVFRPCDSLRFRLKPCIKLRHSTQV
jgi:hypothetical protein